MADVLGVLPAVPSRGGRDRFARVREELAGLLIHTHHGHARIVRAGVGVRDILHPGGKLPAGLGRDRPALLQVRAKPCFFKTRPIVGWSRSGMSATSAACFSSRRRLHRSYPFGGWLHANAITRASISPVTFGSTGGVSRFLRVIVASISPPESAQALETS